MKVQDCLDKNCPWLIKAAHRFNDKRGGKEFSKCGKTAEAIKDQNECPYDGEDPVVVCNEYIAFKDRIFKTS